MTRPVFRNLALLLALSFVAAAVAAPVASAIPPPPLEEQCVDVRPGVVACGEAFVEVPGVGAGAGVATGLVDWQLVVRTNHGTGASPVVNGPAAALAAVGPSTTRDCATAILYADGVEVARSVSVCWIL